MRNLQEKVKKKAFQKQQGSAGEIHIQVGYEFPLQNLSVSEIKCWLRKYL